MTSNKSPKKVKKKNPLPKNKKKKKSCPTKYQVTVQNTTETVKERKYGE